MSDDKTSENGVVLGFEEKGNLVKNKPKPNRKKNKRQSSDDDNVDRIPPTELYRTLSAAIHGTNSFSKFPIFYDKPRLVLDQQHDRVWFREDEFGNLRPLKADGFKSMILQYLNANLGKLNPQDWDWSPARVKEFEQWASLMWPTIEPKVFKFLGDEGHAYATIPMERPEPSLDHHTPIFDSILTRMDDPEAFAAWVGSLFDMDTPNEQYLYMCGPGGDSKGALAQLLKKLFGGAYFSQEVLDKNNQFWSKDMINKRLVVFPDNDNQSFVATGKFKQMTGGDDIRFEHKGGDSGNFRMTAKFAFFSNVAPMIRKTRANMRRIIYIEIAPIEGPPDLHFINKLEKEVVGIVSKCLYSWRDCLEWNGGIIKAKNSSLPDGLHIDYEEFEVFFDETFEVGENKSITGKNLARLLEEKYYQPKDRSQFRKFLRDQGFKYTAMRDDFGRVTKGYKGFGAVPIMERKGQRSKL